MRLRPHDSSERTTTSDRGSAKHRNGEIFCRDYLWGTCNKHTKCIYRHELDIDKMKEILKFCHDYQNKNGCCVRPNCTFIHATKEEQNAFETTGQVPRALAERHAAVAAAASNMNAETIPQIAMFINESFMTQPPPAPWPPLPPAQAALPVAMGPVPSPVLPSRAPSALPPVPHAQQPPPPPAPTPAPIPAPAPTPAPPNLQVCPAPTSYNTMQTQSSATMFTLHQPPPNLEDFDASRPPPPIPTHINANNPNKRKSDNNGNVAAGCNKTRKEYSEGSENFCESCLERKSRIDGCKLEMDALHNEEETQNLMYKKKLQEYEMGRKILKSLVEPDLFRLFDDLIEAAQTPQIPANLRLANSFFPGTTGEPLQDQRNTIEPVPSTSREDETQSSRQNVNNFANQAPDLVNLVMETIRNTERFPSNEAPRNEAADMSRLSNNRTNLANGHKSQQSVSETARYGVAAGFSGPGMQGHEFGAPAQQNFMNYPMAGPSGYAGGPHVPPPPPGYPMPYHMGMPPPPNRHYYPNPASNVQNMHYNGAVRASVPGPSQGMQPPASPAALRPNHPNAPNYN